jgi:hypothetical protein
MIRSVTKIGLFLFSALFPMLALADTVVLQTGEILKVETSWFSKDQVYFSINGVKLSIPKRYVKRIEGSAPGANPSLGKQESDPVASVRTNINTTVPATEPLQPNPAGHQPEPSASVEQTPPEPSVLAEQTPMGNAFRGLSWADRLADIAGMQPMETQTGLDDVREYVRPGDALKLGQALLSSIVYAFWRERLYTISIWTQGLSNYTALRRELFARYGDKMLARKAREACYWSVGPTDMMLEYLDEGQFGLFWMRSQELDQKLKGSTFNHELAYLKWMRSVSCKSVPQPAQTIKADAPPAPAAK